MRKIIQACKRLIPIKHLDIDKGVQVSDKNLQDIKEYIAKKIFNGKEYQLSDLTKDKVTYEQTYKDYPIMNNSKARLTFNLSDGKATSYKQTTMMIYK